MMRVLVGSSGKGEELNWEAMSSDELVSLASTPALLGGARTFRMSGALAGRDELLDLAEVFAESPHTFIFEEEKLLTAPTEALKKAGAKIEVAPAKKKEEPLNIFALGGALAARDRKKLWLLLLQALRGGASPEAVAGVLAWKARQMKDAELSRQLVTLYHDSHRGAGDLELLLERFALML